MPCLKLYWHTGGNRGVELLAAESCKCLLQAAAEAEGSLAICVCFVVHQCVLKTLHLEYVQIKTGDKFKEKS